MSAFVSISSDLKIVTSASRIFVILITALVLLCAPARAQDQSNESGTIKLGELNSYGRYEALTVPYRNGWQLALQEINANGGVLGKQIEVISQDDGATAERAIRVANALVGREKVSMLFGTTLSHVALAVSNYASQNKVPFLAVSPVTDALSLEAGSKYTFRLRPGTFAQTSMLISALEDTDINKWAIVAPNYAYGRAAAAAFRHLIAKANPDATIVAEQYPALGGVNPDPVLSTIAQAEAEGVFIALFGGDLAKLATAANNRSAFDEMTVLSPLAGEPEWLKSLAGTAPEGWLVTGYPGAQVSGLEHQAFVVAYVAKFGEAPTQGSLLGYITMQAIAAAIDRVKSTEAEALVRGFRGLEFTSAVGPITFRETDHQSTLGSWTGKLITDIGGLRMTDWDYRSGEDYRLPEDEVSARRPK